MCWKEMFDHVNRGYSSCDAGWVPRAGHHLFADVIDDSVVKERIGLKSFSFANSR